MRKGLLLLCLLLAAIAAPVSAQDTPITTRDAAPDASAFELVQLATGLFKPLYITNAGDGSGRLFVVQQGGIIYVFDNGVQVDAPFLDITPLIHPDANGNGFTERGLLGLDFAPDYATSGVFYVFYSNVAGDHVLERYNVSAANPNAADPDSGRIIWTLEDPYPNHNGGQIEFGPDGYLYVGVGDGGDAGDPQNNAQNTNVQLGKILRLDVTGQDRYAIPADNPFANGGGAGEVWSYGLRNPWRFSFDRATGDLYIADVGQNMWEEINFQAADSAGGENYGWVPYEGSHPYTGGPAPAGAVMPIAEYSHNEGVSITGGYVYRGSAIPALQGVYLYADFGSGIIWGAWRDASGAWQSQVLVDTPYTISSFGEDEGGELYIVDYVGNILRFNAAS